MILVWIKELMSKIEKYRVFVSGLHEEHSDHGSVCGHDRGGALTGSKHNGVRGMKIFVEKYRTLVRTIGCYS